MKEQADKKRRDIEFQEGHLVYLRVQPYKLKNLANRQHEKLAPRFYGPNEVQQRIGKVAYKLKLPETAHVHPTFHVSQLKRSLSPNATAQPLPSFLTEDYELQVQPEKVLKVRKLTDGSQQVSVKWQQLSDCDNTWEDSTLLAAQFPNFHLEDKVVLLGGGNDGSTTTLGRTYHRTHPNRSKSKDQKRTPQDNRDHSIDQGSGETIIQGSAPLWEGRQNSGWLMESS